MLGWGLFEGRGLLIISSPRVEACSRGGGRIRGITVYTLKTILLSHGTFSDPVNLPGPSGVIFFFNLNIFIHKLNPSES